MKTKNFLAALTLVLLTLGSAFAQTAYNCEGCPELDVRPEKNLSLIADATDGGLLQDNTVLTCDTLWILNRKIYVEEGQTLTILPGTVIKATYDASGVNASALIVARGGKIYANGSECCPIIFTAVDDDLDGSYPLTTQAKWGGVILLGKAHNTVGQGEFNPENPAFLIGSEGSAGIGIIEGVDAADLRHYYGMRRSIPYGEAFVNNDNSGSMKYVSIRHGGSQLGTANEINGLTLGSVGYGTTLRNIEIVGNYDDGIEFFGGTVDLKYARLLYCGDDYLDWDQGYTGRIQHVVAVQHSQITNNPPLSQPGFSGIEADGDDGIGTYARDWRSDPVVSNLTIIGNGAAGGPERGLRLKERTKGEIYNTILTHFSEGIDLANALGDSVTIRKSTFVNMLVKNVDGTPVAGNSFDGLPYDPAGAGTGNLFPATLAGMTYGPWHDGAGPLPDIWDAVPLSAPDAIDFSSRTEDPAKQGKGWYPTDSYYDFFDLVNYRGAFKPGDETWWSMSDCSLMGDANTNQDSYTNLSKPSDINNDGITDAGDLNIVLGRWALTNDQ